MTYLLRLTGQALAGLFLLHAAHAQVQQGAAPLSLALAMDAAQAAVSACEAQSWPVSVSVVDSAGVVRLQAKGDHSMIHTETTSFRKAYTVVTMGPIFHFDASSDFARLVASNPAGPALTSVKNVIPLAGAVAVKRGDEIIAAIGVGGAPGGDKDEACAHAGLARIAEKLSGS